MPKKTNRFGGFWSHSPSKAAVPRNRHIERKLQEFIRARIRSDPGIGLEDLIKAAMSALPVSEREVRETARRLKAFPETRSRGRSGDPATRDVRTVIRHPAEKRTGKNARKKARRRQETG